MKLVARADVVSVGSLSKSVHFVVFECPVPQACGRKSRADVARLQRSASPSERREGNLKAIAPGRPTQRRQPNPDAKLSFGSWRNCLIQMLVEVQEIFKVISSVLDSFSTILTSNGESSASSLHHRACATTLSHQKVNLFHLSDKTITEIAQHLSAFYHPLFNCFNECPIQD
jgi:hypothetical protein